MSAMFENDEQYAYFTVVGDFVVDDISKRLRVSPSKSWNKGDVDVRTGRERRFSRWSLMSRLDRHQPLEDHVIDVLDQLDVHPEGFEAVSRECGGILQIVAYFHDGYPGFAISGDITERLGRYRLTLDFDLYMLHSDAREDT